MSVIRLNITHGAGSRFVGAPVALSEPKTAALLAQAERALSQSTKPFRDALDRINAKYATINEPTAEQTTAHDEAIAANSTRMAESPAVIAATAEVARLSGILADERAKQKPVSFSPLSHDGETATGWSRYTLTREQYDAWEDEKDGDKRAAILAAASSTKPDGKSPIGITRSQQSALVPGLYASRDAMNAALRAGILAVPSDRSEKAAKTSKSKRTPDEKTEAALDFLFAGLEDEPTTDETPEGGQS